MEISYQELRIKIGAGRKRRGLFTLFDHNGNPTTNLAINAEPVKVVIIYPDSHALFFGGQTGEKELATFLCEPYTIDDTQ